MRIGIIGAGTMGTGIAQVAATSGCEVHIYDANANALKMSRERVKEILHRLLEKSKITPEDHDQISDRIKFQQQLEGLKSCDLVIEAIVENFEVKKSVFQSFENMAADDCIIATNTSSLSVTSLASVMKKPDRFIGIHFFNPAPLMKLVEVIPAVQTDNEIVTKCQKILADWEKNTVIAKDTPGFIVNKVARPFYGEALRILDEGIADHMTIDWAMKTYGGFRMGPFELMDFIGNDVNYLVTETVFNAFYQDPRYKPSFTQKRLFEAGYLGRKSGRGYYDYRDGAVNPGPVQNTKLGKQIFERILMMLINEASDTVHMGIASVRDVDLAMTKGVNYPKGLLQWADEVGAGECVKRIDSLYDQYHEDRYRCSALLRSMAKESKLFTN